MLNQTHIEDKQIITLTLHDLVRWLAYGYGQVADP